MDEINHATESFARRTENVEFVTALGLSDFYFGPDTPTTISFEMRREFTGGPIATYEELIDNIESSTHIDCAVSDGARTRISITPMKRLSTGSLKRSYRIIQI